MYTRWASKKMQPFPFIIKIFYLATRSCHHGYFIITILKDLRQGQSALSSDSERFLKQVSFLLINKQVKESMHIQNAKHRADRTEPRAETKDPHTVEIAASTFSEGVFQSQ